MGRKECATEKESGGAHAVTYALRLSYHDSLLEVNELLGTHRVVLLSVDGGRNGRSGDGRSGDGDRSWCGRRNRERLRGLRGDDRHVVLLFVLGRVFDLFG